jgi:hypothetical protein
VPRYAFALLAGATAALLLSLAMASSAYADGVPFAKGDVLANVGGSMVTGFGEIRHFTNTGTLVDTLNTTVTTTEGDGMCFDGSGNLYATEGFGGNTVSKFDSGGNLLLANFGSGYNADPESCVVDQAGDVYVGQPDGSHNVLKFNSAGTLLASYAPMIQDRGTDWIDLASDQCTLHYTSEGSSILQFNVCTNTQRPDFADNLPGGTCYGHRILPDGGELVACSSQIDRVNASGAVTQTYTLPGTSLLFAVNLDPDGTTFWTADYFTGQIFRINIATGSVVTTFTSPPNTVMGGLAVVGELTAAIDAPISSAGVGTINPIEGKAFTTAVATVTDPDTSATASEYSASINWGDGSTSVGTISGTGGKFTVTGTHTYAEEGTHTVTVTTTDVDNTPNTATATSTAKVADAALTAAGVQFSAKKGVKFSHTVATFTDANVNAPTSDFTASISWGDGKTSTGSVAKSGTGFKVSGSHTYTKSGTFKVTVKVTDKGGSTATANSTIKVGGVTARARLSAVPTKCVVSSRVSLQVVGSDIKSVKWTEDGHTVTGTTKHKGSRYSASIKTSPGKHHVTVKVKFRNGKSRTLHATVTGCHKVKFTG